MTNILDGIAAKPSNNFSLLTLSATAGNACSADDEKPQTGKFDEAFPESDLLLLDYYNYEIGRDGTTSTGPLYEPLTGCSEGPPAYHDVPFIIGACRFCV